MKVCTAFIAAINGLNTEGKMRFATILITFTFLGFFANGLNAQCITNVITNEQAGLEFGTWTSANGDMNGDGFDDIAVAAGALNMVYVYSGMNSDLLYSISVDMNNYNDVPVIDIGGDINNDGYDDLIAGAPNTPYGGVNAYSGRNGSLIYTFEGDSTAPNLGNCVGYIGDINNDGCDDIIAQDDITRVIVFSGKTGAKLYTYSNTAPHDLWGILSGGLGDVNNDGYNDFFISDIGSLIGNMYGWVYVFSGFDGDTLYTFKGGRNNDALGWRAFGPGDINGDGYDDILASSMDTTFLFSGATGNKIHAFPLRATNFFQAGDINQDGIIDLGFTTEGGISNYVTIYSGATFTRILLIPGDFPAGGDLENDGYSEFLFRIPIAAIDTLAQIALYKYGDSDCDGYANAYDICPYVYNPVQEDHDQDGIGDSCDTCDEVEIKMGSAAIFMEGTTTDGISETANLPFQVKITSLTEECYSVSTINAMHVETRFDPEKLTFDSAFTNSSLWDGTLDYSIIPVGAYDIAVVHLENGGKPISSQLKTYCYLSFKAKCQHDLDTASLDIASTTQVGDNWVVVDDTYYPYRATNGTIYSVMGENPCFACGDFNMSDAVNILDITAFLNYLYKGGPGPANEWMVDVNHSGSINLLDVTYLIAYLYRGGPEPDCP
ncbi:MAG: dockerin type I domain-containing protein [Candidatus Zixiibacteriota bacterium]